MQSIVGGCMALAQEWLRNKMKMWTPPKRKWAFWPLSTTCSPDKRYPSAECGYHIGSCCPQPFSLIMSQTKGITVYSLQKACSFAEELHLHLKPRRELTEFLKPAFVVCHLFNTKGKRQNLLCIPLFFFLFILYRICKEDLTVEYSVELRVWKSSEKTQTCTQICKLSFIKLILKLLHVVRVTASPHVLIILSLCSLWKSLPLITAEVWEWMTLKMILAATNIQRFALTGGMDITGADLISSP